jgi:two-component system, chemotaxis family, protein-glutamate methylesterase/glutaminase
VIPERQIRQTGVLVVDDSAFMRTALTRMIASDPELRVVGTAHDGADAMEKLPSLDPDVVTLDLDMPGLNGLETLQCIMARYPRPVIMVSSVTSKDAEATFNALGAGAFDYVPKQLSDTSLDIVHIRHDLVTKIKAAAEARRNSAASLRQAPPAVYSFDTDPVAATPVIAAIGTSTGGPKALEEILPVFPASLRIPLLIVQHMPMGFTAPFAHRLNSMCSVPVREASQREVIRPGVAYIAPAGAHMRVERSEERSAELSPVIHLSPEPVRQHVPSVDVLMESVAAVFGNLSIGVIMTGMGDDGVNGMRAIHRTGGFTLGQDEASCAVYGMPRACAEHGLLKRVVPLAEIPRQILQATSPRKRALEAWSGW